MKLKIGPATVAVERGDITDRDVDLAARCDRLV